MTLTDKQKQDIEKAITNNIKGCLLKDGEMSSPKDGYKIGLYGESSAVSEIECIVSATCIQKDEKIARLNKELGNLGLDYNLQQIEIARLRKALEEIIESAKRYAKENNISEDEFSKWAIPKIATEALNHP